MKLSFSLQVKIVCLTVGLSLIGLAIVNFVVKDPEVGSTIIRLIGLPLIGVGIFIMIINIMGLNKLRHKEERQGS